MATPFHLELVTPERVLFSGETDEVSLRSDGGEISFLARHADYVGAVDITTVHISAPSADGAAPSHDAAGDEIRAAVHGGFVEVNEKGVVILAGVAELASEIDVPRAQQALSAAQERLANKEPAAATEHHEGEEAPTDPSLMSGAMLALLAPESPEAAVRRAQVRLDVAGVTAS